MSYSPCHAQSNDLSLICFCPTQDTQSRGKGSAVQTHTHTHTKEVGFPDMAASLHMCQCQYALAFHTAETDEQRWRFSAFRLAKCTPGGGRAGEEVTGSVSPRSNTAAASDDVHAHAVGTSTTQLVWFSMEKDGQVTWRQLTTLQVIFKTILSLVALLSSVMSFGN